MAEITLQSSYLLSLTVVHIRTSMAKSINSECLFSSPPVIIYRSIRMRWQLKHAGFGIRFARLSPYFPDLAPSDSHLLPNSKKFVSEKCFAFNEERALVEYFHSLPDSHFLEEVLMFKKRWTKCVEVKGD
ncbi:hypothetical protein TNCV_4565471 [Trichonephila clavipes]|nr:hypothetical protein TNCV_4565471 [Trichonephila clavipes]